MRQVPRFGTSGRSPPHPRSCGSACERAEDEWSLPGRLAACIHTRPHRLVRGLGEDQIFFPFFGRDVVSRAMRACRPRCAVAGGRIAIAYYLYMIVENKEAWLVRLAQRQVRGKRAVHSKPLHTCGARNLESWRWRAVVHFSRFQRALTCDFNALR
jgi:hypothetical protein